MTVNNVTSHMYRMLFLSAFFVLLFLAEEKHPLRRSVDNKWWRVRNNAAIGGISALLLAASELPVTRISAHLVQTKRVGLLQAIALPAWLHAVLSFVLLDYSIYVWHVMLHKVPLLWRFHQAHHTDRDLDVTTSMRFHFGELLFSSFWRCATILTLGISKRELSAWETFFMAEIMFHHSNVRLALPFESWLNRFVVTPRMHGIHHSQAEEQTNSNWSSGLTFWDRLHRTLKLDVDQDSIIIGARELRSSRAVGLAGTLTLPFGRTRPAALNRTAKSRE